MSERFTFICAKTTADFVVPVSASSQAGFNRNVHNAFQGLVGGILRVGDLKDRPTQASIDSHLLCDGSTIYRANYPELVEYLNPGGETAALPDYTGAVVITTPTVTQTVTPSGTIQTDETAPTDQGDAGGTEGGNIPSGGRISPADMWRLAGRAPPEELLEP